MGGGGGRGLVSHNVSRWLCIGPYVCKCVCVCVCVGSDNYWLFERVYCKAHWACITEGTEPKKKSLLSLLFRYTDYLHNVSIQNFLSLIPLLFQGIVFLLCICCDLQHSDPLETTYISVWGGPLVRLLTHNTEVASSNHASGTNTPTPFSF